MEEHFSQLRLSHGLLPGSFQKFLHGSRHVFRLLMIKADASSCMAVIHFIVITVSFVRHVLQEGVAHKSHAHAVTAHVECSDLLVKL